MEDQRISVRDIKLVTDGTGLFVVYTDREGRSHRGRFVPVDSPSISSGGVRPSDVPPLEAVATTGYFPSSSSDSEDSASDFDVADAPAAAVVTESADARYGLIDSPTTATPGHPLARVKPSVLFRPWSFPGDWSQFVAKYDLQSLSRPEVRKVLRAAASDYEPRRCPMSGWNIEIAYHSLSKNFFVYLSKDAKRYKHYRHGGTTLINPSAEFVWCIRRDAGYSYGWHSFIADFFLINELEPGKWTFDVDPVMFCMAAFNKGDWFLLALNAESARYRSFGLTWTLDGPGYAFYPCDTFDVSDLFARFSRTAVAKRQ